MYALRILDNADDAEDIVEEAFMKAWKAISSGTEIDNFNSYIYRSIRNECVSLLRKKTDFEDIDNVPEISEEVIDTSVRDARIWKAIDSLPEKCREIFLMSKRDGFSNQEIADELGISIKTVKNQMTKALSRLREALSTGHRPFFLPFL
ncbi:MAG: sigma-70 family RNA polymerase sigma factor [Bacteroidales bacterium]|nr:sigma-70 family RNA polymerase sigma factor [Bacteroidales bacterium]